MNVPAIEDSHKTIRTWGMFFTSYPYRYVETNEIGIHRPVLWQKSRFHFQKSQIDERDKNSPTRQAPN